MMSDAKNGNKKVAVHVWLVYFTLFVKKRCKNVVNLIGYIFYNKNLANLLNMILLEERLRKDVKGAMRVACTLDTFV